MAQAEDCERGGCLPTTSIARATARDDGEGCADDGGSSGGGRGWRPSGDGERRRKGQAAAAVCNATDLVGGRDTDLSVQLPYRAKTERLCVLWCVAMSTFFEFQF